MHDRVDIGNVRPPRAVLCRRGDSYQPSYVCSILALEAVQIVRVVESGTNEPRARFGNCASVGYGELLKLRVEYIWEAAASPPGIDLRIRTCDHILYSYLWTHRISRWAY
jgi:hypothetical protein